MVFLGVKQDVIVVVFPYMFVAIVDRGRLVAPDNTISKSRLPEDLVKDQADMRSGSPVTVIIKGACGFEDLLNA